MRAMGEIFNQILQIGIVVDDIERVRKTMKLLFGKEPVASRAGVQKAANAFYYGEPASFSAEVNHYDFGHIEVEFMQPLTGPSAWKDHLEKHGSSIHHIMFNVEDKVEAEEALAAHGIKPILRGDSTRGGGEYWQYFDLKDLGFAIEVVSGRKVGNN